GRKRGSSPLRPHHPTSGWPARQFGSRTSPCALGPGAGHRRQLAKVSGRGELGLDSSTKDAAHPRAIEVAFRVRPEPRRQEVRLGARHDAGDSLLCPKTSAKYLHGWAARRTPPLFLLGIGAGNSTTCRTA